MSMIGGRVRSVSDFWSPSQSRFEQAFLGLDESSACCFVRPLLLLRDSSILPSATCVVSILSLEHAVHHFLQSKDSSIPA